MRIHMNVLLKNSESLTAILFILDKNKFHIISWNETLIVIQSGGKTDSKTDFWVSFLNDGHLCFRLLFFKSTCWHQTFISSYLRSTEKFEKSGFLQCCCSPDSEKNQKILWFLPGCFIPTLALLSAGPCPKFQLWISILSKSAFWQKLKKKTVEKGVFGKIEKMRFFGERSPFEISIFWHLRRL